MILSNTFPIRALLPILISVSAAFLISCYSGYESTPVPFEILWRFTPLGLLSDLRADLFEIRNGTLFDRNLFLGFFQLKFSYLSVFLKTCALEAPFYLLLLRRYHVTSRITCLLSSNLLTHPAVYFVFPSLFTSYMTSALASEAFAPITEFLFVFGLSRFYGKNGPKALTVAVVISIANLFSWQMGALV